MIIWKLLLSSINSQKIRKFCVWEVMIAIVFKRKRTWHSWHNVRGSLWIAIVLCTDNDMRCHASKVTENHILELDRAFTQVINTWKWPPLPFAYSENNLLGLNRPTTQVIYISSGPGVDNPLISVIIIIIYLFIYFLCWISFYPNSRIRE